MTPNKIIFYTRPWEVHFQAPPTRTLASEYPEADILFISFISRAIEIAKEAVFEAYSRLRIKSLETGAVCLS